ncbi:hypothetical protein AGMMS50249_1720 [candidate division SR1 bacterium]|nr:hypothetical protein AGMMS50249_1720 [candidate division SR1 bacterium]
MQKYDQALHYEIFQKEEYLPCKSAIQQADVIFDIGGHLGFFSEWCRQQGSQAEVHYFEPVPFLYETAKKNLNSDPKIIFHNYGIGSIDEEITFFVNSKKSMQSSKYPSFLNLAGEEVKVQMKSLETFILNLESGVSNLLVKLDIEGMEYEVLESRTDFIRDQISFLVMEIHFLQPDDEQRRDKLKKEIKSRFSTFQEFPSQYDERIRLVYAEK